MRLSFGRKHKTAPNALQEKLGKACRCSKSLPPGNHKGGCNFHPTNLCSIMKALAVDRAAIDKQLRERTSLTPSQRKEAVDHLFALEQAAASSGSSSSSKCPSFLENVQRPEGVCIKLCECVLQPVRLGFGDLGTSGFFLTLAPHKRTCADLCGLGCTCADFARTCAESGRKPPRHHGASRCHRISGSSIYPDIISI